MRFLFVALFSLLLVSPVDSQQIPPVTLATRVRLDVDKVSAINALLQIGQQYRIPIAIEVPDEALAKSQLTIHEENTLGNILLRVFESKPSFRFVLDSGILRVTPTAAGTSVLDVVLPTFKLRSDTIQWTGVALWMAAQQTIDSSISGFAGHFSTGPDRPRVGPFDLRNVTVRNVLDQIILQAGGAAWTLDDATDWQKLRKDRTPWSILIYQSPPQPFQNLCCHK